MKTDIDLIPCQKEFFLSNKRFVCFKAGIAIGKTFLMLLKVMEFCKRYPNAQGLIVRKEFTDLEKSTIKDFRAQFNMELDSHKTVYLDNGSTIMFLHAEQVNPANLKNMTLDIIGVEQGDEFENDETFKFLRDRMRGTACPVLDENGNFVLDKDGNKDYFQQMNIVCNANGHNWIWRRWKYQPESDQFHLIEGTTFDNAKNLGASFIADMRSREKTEPRHFMRMCMNSDDEELTDDNVFRSFDLIRSSKLNYEVPKMCQFAAGLDVARYGDDKTCFTILAQVGVKKWKQVFMEEKTDWGAPQIVGWVKDMWEKFPFGTLGVDDIGVGGGCKDYLNDSNKFTVYGFIANEKPNGESPYPNKKSEAMFRLEEYISKDWLEISPDVFLHEELMSVRYYYRGESAKYIVSKDDMRAHGIKSPNKVDALAMALYYADEDKVFEVDDIIVPGVTPSKKKFQEYAITTPQ